MRTYFKVEERVTSEDIFTVWDRVTCEDMFLDQDRMIVKICRRSS